MNDEFLSKYRKQPRPEFAAALYRIIQHPLQAPSRQFAPRAAAAALALFAIMAASLALSPSVRAFAEGMVHRIGGYMFVQPGETVDVGGGTHSLQIDRSRDSVSLVALPLVPRAQDAAGASTLSGFTVLTPSYLPEGFSAMSPWFVTSDDGGKAVSNGYRDATNHFLILNQWKAPDGSARTFARDKIVDVTVRGQTGLWLPDTVRGTAGKNALVWEEGGITYWIITDAVPLDEVLKLAESLGR
jgi:Domain of unknown function (DUF4367)